MVKCCECIMRPMDCCPPLESPPLGGGPFPPYRKVENETLLLQVLEGPLKRQQKKSKIYKINGFLSLQLKLSMELVLSLNK